MKQKKIDYNLLVKVTETNSALIHTYSGSCFTVCEDRRWPSYAEDDKQNQVMMK